jgi:hypothetical protein
MLRTSFIRVATVGFVLLLASICLTAYSQTTITGLNESYTVSEDTTDLDIAVFTVSPTDAQPSVTGDNELVVKVGSGVGAWILAFRELPNYEGRPIHTFTVSAGDAEPVMGTVTITDVDEPPTEIQEDTAPTAIDEVIDGSTESSTGTYSSTDPDNRPISWSISGSDSRYFSITNLGSLTLNRHRAGL